MANTSNRIIGLDYLKVFGIYLMVLGHSPYLPDTIEAIIYSFHMPLFFFISGFLYKEGTIKHIIKSSFCSLIVPYILINVICIGMWIITEIIHGGFTLDNLLSRIGAVSLGLGYERYGFLPVCAPTWFFLALFWCRVATMLYVKFLKQGIVKIIFLLSLLLLIWQMEQYDIQFPYALSSAIMAFPIMLFAFEFRRLLLSHIFLKRHFLVVLVALSLAIPSFILNNSYGRCDIDAVMFGRSILLYYIDAISSCLALFYIFIHITRESKLIKFISLGTIAIVGFHLTIAYYVCKICFWNNLNVTFAAITESFLVMVICFPIILFCGRFFPILLGKKNCIKYE